MHGSDGELAVAGVQRREGIGLHLREWEARSTMLEAPGSSAPGVAGTTNFWTAIDWIPCRDGKSRPVEPGTFPLAHGIPGRVGRLRAYGNAIVPQVAATFVRACGEILCD
jgi:DNA (cytosine-5)-methyltransferase 1